MRMCMVRKGAVGVQSISLCWRPDTARSCQDMVLMLMRRAPPSVVMRLEFVIDSGRCLRGRVEVHRRRRASDTARGSKLGSEVAMEMIVNEKFSVTRI